MNDTEQLLFPDELADAMRRSRVYVYAMKAAGFPMPGGTATLTEARAWLAEHPEFRSTGYSRRAQAVVANNRNQKKKKVKYAK